MRDKILEDIINLLTKQERKDLWGYIKKIYKSQVEKQISEVKK